MNTMTTRESGIRALTVDELDAVSGGNTGYIRDGVLAALCSVGALSPFNPPCRQQQVMNPA